MGEWVEAPLLPLWSLSSSHHRLIEREGGEERDKREDKEERAKESEKGEKGK